MRLHEVFLTEQEVDIVTVSAIKAQTGTKEKIDRWLSDYGLPPSPPVDELVVLLTVKDDNIPYDNGVFFDEMIYTVDTSNWQLSISDGEYGNRMLVANFMSVELGKLQDHYLENIGDDYLETEEGDVEFEFVMCSDVGEEWTQEDLEEMKLSLASYIPSISFQEQVVGVMSVEQFLQLSNGLPVIDDREMA